MARRNVNEHLAMRQVSEKTFKNVGGDTIDGLLETIARIRDLVDLEHPGTEDFFTQQVSHLCEIQTECEAAKSVVEQVRHVLHSIRLRPLGPRDEMLMPANDQEMAVHLQKFEAYIKADLRARVEMNLSGTLAEDMQQAYETHQLRGCPQRTKAWRQWCKETNQHLPEDEEDEELQIEAGAEFRNYRCVLSQKSIFDLAEPVEDSHEYIWEKQAIVQHIRAHHGRATNPANTTLPITEAELKPSRRVLREGNKRRRAAANTQVCATEIL